MKTAVRLAWIVAAALVLLSAAVLALWWAIGAPFEGLQVIVNEDSLTIPGASGADGLLALGGVLLALLTVLVVVLVVVPLALLVGLGVPALLAALGLAVGLLGLGVLLALLCSPLLLPALLVWWLVRRDRQAPRAVPSTTIAG